MKNNINLIDNKSYAIIEKNWEVFVWAWKIHKLNSLNELEQLQQDIRRKIVFITPFCLVRDEKWYEAIWDEPILAMEVEEELTFTREEILDILPDNDIEIWDIKKSISDEDFAKMVGWVKEEIYWWNINQLIISRKFSANVELDRNNLLWMFKKLLKLRWQYMTFLFDTPEETFIWASPERHLTIENNELMMNPIAWTIWKWDLETFPERMIEFLQDEKEIWELWMVIDEELKMMIKITKSWRIEVPLLKECWAVIHTEANLIWKKKNEFTKYDAFRETLYAPTLVWWPIKSAFSLIAKYEQESRWYYGWALGIVWEDFLDTCIVIRTAIISKLKNILSVRAWSWIVEDSNPQKETIETIQKSNWFFGWITSSKSPNKQLYLEGLDFEDKQKIQELLEARKNKLSGFYSESNLNKVFEDERIKWKKFILINNWDDFVFMSWHMIEKMWWIVVIIDNKDFDITQVDNYDLVLLGPWYWDINDEGDERMVKLLNITEELIKNNKKLMWICLWHQAICKVKWFKIKRQEQITQWKQLEVTIDWKKQILWFYNSFSPVVEWESQEIQKFMWDRILNYNSENISSTQAHPESIMSINGFDVLKDMVLMVI